MTSSTSHSNARVPGLAFKLLLVAMVAWAVCAVYSVWLNPEVRFYTALSRIQDAWSRKMELAYTNKVVVYGGSSCTFSIDGEQMLRDYNLPTVNRGLAAGFGVKIPTLNALKDLKRGDTLIVALEPGQLTDSTEPTALATQFSYAVGHPGWTTKPMLKMPAIGRVSSLLALRPGSYHFLTLIGKLVQGRPLYRYDVTNAHPSGWMTTEVRLPIDGPPGHGDYLSDDVKRFLPTLRDWCTERGVRVAYSLPWAYCPTEKIETFQRHNAATLLKVAEFLPVLKDQSLGANPDVALFADTGWHFTAAGATLRTADLGVAIQKWNTWSHEELEKAAGGEH